MAGTTGLEPATSAVTDDKSLTGVSGINDLRGIVAEPVGIGGTCRLTFVQRFVQRLLNQASERIVNRLSHVWKHCRRFDVMLAGDLFRVS